MNKYGNVYNLQDVFCSLLESLLRVPTETKQTASLEAQTKEC